jgi:hypothetical protein
MRVLALCAVLAIAGCASARDAVDKEMASWVGHNQEELITKWGPPRQTMPDGSGGTIWVYYMQHIPGVLGAIALPPVQVDPSHEYCCTRMFYVRDNGTIYAWRWQGL